MGEADALPDVMIREWAPPEKASRRGILKMMRFTRRSSIAALAVLIGLSLSWAPPALGASVGIGGATIDGKSWSADRSLAVPSAIGAKPIDRKSVV